MSKREQMRADFEKNYCSVTLMNISASDMFIIKEIAYTMYLHGAMFSADCAELVDHPPI